MGFIDFTISALIFSSLVFIFFFYFLSQINFSFESNLKEVYLVSEVFKQINSNLYFIKILVNETEGYSKQNAILNININFDPACKLIANETSIRVYDLNFNKIYFNLSNIQYCAQNFIQSANLTFNFSINAYETKEFFVFFSSVGNEKQNFILTGNVYNLYYKVFPIEISNILNIENFDFENFKKENDVSGVKIVVQEKSVILNKTYGYLTSKIFSSCFSSFYFDNEIKKVKTCIYVS